MLIFLLTYIYNLGYQIENEGFQPVHSKDSLIVFGIVMVTTITSRVIDHTCPEKMTKNKDKDKDCSKGFLIDVLSERKSISIHRLQYFLFMILLICIYIINSYQNKAFPKLDTTLLIVSGMSALGYLGIKMIENE